MSTTVFIYSLSHPETGEVRYVGLTRNATRRIQQYRYKGHTKHLDNWLKSIRAIGREVQLSILETVDESISDVAERKWIAHYKAQGAALINFTDGGERSCVVSEETRKKLSASWTPERRQKNAEMIKAAWTPERKKRFREIMRARAKPKPPVDYDARRRRRSERSKEMWKNPEIAARITVAARASGIAAIPRLKQMGMARRGSKLSSEHRAKVSEGVRRSHTPEYRRKMSEIKKGVQWTPMTDEIRSKISASLKGRKLTPEQVEQRRQAIKLRRRDPVTGKLA